MATFQLKIFDDGRIEFMGLLISWAEAQQLANQLKAVKQAQYKFNQGFYL